MRPSARTGSSKSSGGTSPVLSPARIARLHRMHRWPIPGWSARSGTTFEVPVSPVPKARSFKQPPAGPASDRDLPLSARREHIGKRCATRADPTAPDHRIRERPSGPKYVLQTIWPDARCQPPKTDTLGRPCLPRPGFLDCQMFVIGTSVSDLILPPPYREVL